MNEDKFWKDNRYECPWYDQGMCVGQVSYNGHVNDPRYSPCIQELCPIFFWILKLNKNKFN